ncbi:hypothetical protein BDV11DRAFT_208014 [Aspergillus similis]
MTTFHFSGQQLDNDLVTLISSLLDAINVPNLLWSNYLLTVYRVPTIVDDVTFVVSDALIRISFSTLAEAGLDLCSRHLDCPYSNSIQCQPPYKHLHINDELAISLYPKSDVLWEFPEFGAAFHGNRRDIMLASNARLPPATLGRDYGTARETSWMAILTYILKFFDGTDNFDEGGLREGRRLLQVKQD